jgi:hypothetical protein
MNRNFLFIPFVVLIFFGIELLINGKPDVDIGSSPRAVQYREKINKLIVIGGGNISEACSVSLKHTVLVTCKAHTVNIIAIQEFLSADGWQKISDTEPNTIKYKNINDVLTIGQRGSSYVISLRAEK